MNRDTLTHISRFLVPNELQTMALINCEHAATIRYAYQGPIQREPIRTWNHIRKQFYTEQIGSEKWMTIDMDQFLYMDHIEMMFDLIIENDVDNLVIVSSNRYKLTEEQFNRFVHHVITRKHHLGTIVIRLLKITDQMYIDFFNRLKPVIHDMKLQYIACDNGRMIYRGMYL